jgi:hypothetical protein
MIHVVNMIRNRFPGRPIAPLLAVVAALGLAAGLSLMFAR